MNELFWRVAHRRYHHRVPGRLPEAALLVGGFFFLIVYSAALIAGWKPGDGLDVILGLAMTLVPLVMGAVHWRIRVEASKGSDALYRKLVAARASGSAR